MIRRPIGREMARTAVVVGTATAVSGRVARRQDEKYMAEEQQQNAEAEQAQAPVAAEASTAAPAAQGLTSEDLDKLKELAALKDQGVLTEAEFDAEKAKILGS
jgi:hypothetical protein